MADELLKYYNQELTYLRHLGSEFAERYPKVAGRLKLSDEVIEDPHVSRLLEGVSFLTARIRQKLDDSFPELTDALLGHMYPDYQAPIPSMSIAQVTPKNLNDFGVTLPRGCELTTEVPGFAECQFQTCYDVRLWPVEIDSVRFQNAPFRAPKSIWRDSPSSILKISVKSLLPKVNLSDIGVDSLRFYLNGQLRHNLALYQHLFRDCIGMAITPEGNHQEAVYLEKRHLKAVGFEPEHAVVPYQSKSFAGYRLLIEQSLFPQKFLFFELDDLRSRWKQAGAHADIYLYFSESSTELEQQVSDSQLMLGCTPMVNLFEERLEPIRLETAEHEYRLTASFAKADTREIIRPTDVEVFNHSRQRRNVRPYYAEGHPAYLDDDDVFWTVRREPGQWARGNAEPGTEAVLSIVDRQAYGAAFEQNDGWMLGVKALCSNRNVPARLPYGGGQPFMQTSTHADVVEEIRCLTPPTTVVRPSLGEDTRWQLVSHLTLNHFSGEGAAQRVREVLKLYDFRASPETKVLLQAIYDVKITAATSRLIRNGRVAFAHGNDIQLVFTQHDAAGSSLFFLGSVLDYFFSQFASVNSFTRLSISILDEARPVHQWPARAGGVPLV
ncbi:type VI secretion system baseplate subunit TssF [Pokkaliibacter sp. CJK22405]|uniref:type VI secretion system baseplate subunit TssF n=1 Tax=Pokkaliibacter sp. CJK22405 TaxID=3384615 RepID=UPI00398462A9